MIRTTVYKGREFNKLFSGVDFYTVNNRILSELYLHRNFRNNFDSVILKSERKNLMFSRKVHLYKWLHCGDTVYKISVPNSACVIFDGKIFTADSLSVSDRNSCISKFFDWTSEETCNNALMENMCNINYVLNRNSIRGFLANRNIYNILAYHDPTYIVCDEAIKIDKYFVHSIRDARIREDLIKKYDIN